MASSDDLSRAAWRTSSYSNNGGNCVEIAAAAGVIGVRDTRHRQAAVLILSPQAWERFTRSLKG